MARSIYCERDAEEMTEDIRAMTVRHSQRYVFDTIKIYDPDGNYVDGTRELRLADETSLESAVGAIWAGVDHAFSIAGEYGTNHVIVYSDIKGAAHQFGREWDGLEETA